jgi:hypothetical protein
MAHLKTAAALELVQHAPPQVNAQAMGQLDKLGQVLGGAGAGARVLSASEEAGVASARLELRSN